MPFLHPREVAPAPSTHAFFPLSLPGAAAQLKPSEPACLAPSLPRLAHSVLPPLPPEPPRASLLTLTLAAAAPDERPTTFAFLSGSFPLPPSPASAELSLPSLNPPTPETTAFAQTATALEELLRYVALGVDDLREAWVGKGGSGTATREWVASIGDALRQHGEDGDVRRALGALLLTGRPGEGLMNLLGGKLTPRVSRSTLLARAVSPDRLTLHLPLAAADLEPLGVDRPDVAHDDPADVLRRPDPCDRARPAHAEGAARVVALVRPLSLLAHTPSLLVLTLPPPLAPSTGPSATPPTCGSTLRRSSRRSTSRRCSRMSSWRSRRRCGTSTTASRTFASGSPTVHRLRPPSLLSSNADGSAGPASRRDRDGSGQRLAGLGRGRPAARRQAQRPARGRLYPGRPRRPGRRPVLPPRRLCRGRACARSRVFPGGGTGFQCRRRKAAPRDPDHRAVGHHRPPAVVCAASRAPRPRAVLLDLGAQHAQVARPQPLARAPAVAG